jgi:FkbM family methyltransferase
MAKEQMMGLIHKFFMKINKSHDKVLKQQRKGHIDKKILIPMLPTSPVIVEAGAHVGYDTVELATLWPQGVIHSFEPVPELFSKLKENTRYCRNVYRYNLALADQTGNAKLFLSSGKSDGSSSLLTPKEHLTAHPDVIFEKEVSVTTITLDDWAKQHQVKNIDFLWLDLQGYELAVLRAMPDMLASVRLIYTEVSLIEAYTDAPLYPELRDWLEEQGFHVVIEDLPWPDMGNVLFSR